MESELHYCILPRKVALGRGISRYMSHKSCPNGAIFVRRSTDGKCLCAECAKSVQDKVAKWRLENPEKKVRQSRKHYEKNKQEYIARSARWRESNKEERKKIIKDYYHRHKDCPMAIARATSRKMVIRVINATGRKKNTKSAKILGYMREEFISHIEMQFKPGMSWANHGEWHIDHIKPVSAFLAEGITDPAVINSLDNLQPLWAEDNLRKGAKWDSEEDQQS